MRRAVTALLIALALVASALTTPATAGDGWRTVKHVTYNGALSLHEAAVPSGYATAGTKMKVECLKAAHGCKNKTLTVHAVAGGCSCWDLSDEGINAIAKKGTSDGVIKARFRKV